MATFFGSQFEISLPSEPFAAPAMVGDVPVPSSKLWEAMFDGASQADLERIALDSAVFNAKDALTIVITMREPEEHDTVLRQIEIPRGEFSLPAWIVERHEQVRFRPWLMGQMARFEMEPETVSLMAVCQLLKERGRAAFALVDRKLFHCPEDRVQMVMGRFGIAGKVEQNAHLLTRVGVLMKRPGGLAIDLELPAGRFEERDNDGTVVISSKVTTPLPGTLKVGGSYYKGMVRPPLIVDGRTESEAVVATAQFGLATPDGVTAGKFCPVRTLPHERASLNYQAILFGAVHPEQVFAADNARLKAMKIADLFDAETRAKIEAGVPPAMFMGEMGPWKWQTQIDLGKHAARATVFGSHLVPVGSCRMLPATFRRFSWVEEDEDGNQELCWEPQVVLHRDPAVPNASSMALYMLEGEAAWLGGDDGAEGIVVNPKDPRWRAAGGDFDGDAAVAFVPFFDLKDQLPSGAPLKLKQGMKAVQFRGRMSFAATLISMATGFTGRLGPAVMTAMRIAERGQLTKEVAIEASRVIQGSVDAKKHPVDSKTGEALYGQLRKCEDLVRPSGGFLLDHVHAVRKATGMDAKVAAWEELLQEVKDRKDLTPIEAVMVERIKILDEIFRKTQWLRGDRVTLPETMRTQALAWMLEEGETEQATARVQQLSRAYRRAGQDLAQAKAAGQDDAAHEAGERLREARLKIRLALHHGEISEAALVAKGPGKLAAEFCSSSTFAELGHTARFLETVLFGTQWVDGPLPVAQLDPIPSCRKQVETTLGTQMVSEVQVKVLGGNERTRRVVLTW